MDDAKIQEGFTRIENLIDNLAALCVREFKNISDRFADADARFAKIDERFVGVDERLAKIEGHIEAFGRRVDDEVEGRHYWPSASRSWRKRSDLTSFDIVGIRRELIVQVCNIFLCFLWTATASTT
jgi:hypothetical protein